MEITGIVKRVTETKTVGTNGFQVREAVITTEEQYPQILEIKFTQNRVNLLDGILPNQRVKIDVNLKGREQEKEGKLIVYNSIEGWKVEKLA
jgi:hypothetical protein